MVLVDREGPLRTGRLDQGDTLRRFERYLHQTCCWVRMKGHPNDYLLIVDCGQSRTARDFVAGQVASQDCLLVRILYLVHDEVAEAVPTVERSL